LEEVHRRWARKKLPHAYGSLGNASFFLYPEALPERHCHIPDRLRDATCWQFFLIKTHKHMLLETNLIKRCLRGIKTRRSHQGTRRLRKRLESPSCARAQRPVSYVVSLLQTESPLIPNFNFEPLILLLGRFFKIRDDYMNLQLTEYGNQKGFVRTWMRGSIPIRLSVSWPISLNTRVRSLEFSDRGRLDSTNRHAFHWKRKCLFFNS
jgi:hypothetical protein